MRIGVVTEQVDPRARAELRRQQRIAVAHRGGWPEIPRRHLTFGPFGTITDERDGTGYRVHRGEVDQATPAVAAYYLTAGQEIVFLEKRAKR